MPIITAILFMNVSMAIFRAPTVALMPDVTPPPLRSKANGVINPMGSMGPWWPCSQGQLSTGSIRRIRLSWGPFS